MNDIMHASQVIDPYDVAVWNNGPQWLGSTNGDASTDQPATMNDLARSGHFHGPFESEQSACEWARKDGYYD